jgi:methionyl-tRNA formyltransferase
MGSPTFALPSLEALIEARLDPVLVVSQPDRPAGRRRRQTPPPVAEAARLRGLPLYQPVRLREPEDLQPLVDVRPDLIVVAAFGLILPRALLDLPRLGCINVHPSLLPRWRGAAPIQATLLAGDRRTGVSIMQVEQRMDAGPVITQESVEFLPPGADARFSAAWMNTALPPPEEDAASLEPRLARVGARLLVESLGPLVAGKLEIATQDEDAATYCRRFARSDMLLDWSQPASHLARQVRAFRGRGDAFTTWRGRVLKVLSARELDALPGQPGPGNVIHGPREMGRCPLVTAASGLLALYGVSLEGRPPVDGPAFLNGQPDFVGSHLGSADADQTPLAEPPGGR